MILQRLVEHYDRMEAAKHLDQFSRRARRGACFTRPYLGCREFAAHFALLEPDSVAPEPHETLRGERDLGWMLHDLDFAQNKKDPPARFFRAHMRDGVIAVPSLTEATA